MKKIGILLLLVAFYASGCKTKQKVAPVNTVSVDTEEPAETKGPCMDQENDIAWSEEKGRMKDKLRDRIPENSKVFQVTERNLNATLKRVFSERKEIRIVLPVYRNGKIECVQFALSNSETMSRELQKKYSHYSFKGFDVTDDRRSGRFDFTEEMGLRGYLNFDGEIYLYEPMKLGNNTYYVCYNKKDALSGKEEFEIR